MVETQFALSVDLGFLDMHVEAEGAAIHLRSPDMDEVMDFLFDDAAVHGCGQVHELLEKLRRLLCVIEALGHVFLLLRIFIILVD